MSGVDESARSPVTPAQKADALRSIVVGIGVHLGIVAGLAALYFIVPVDVQTNMALYYQDPHLLDFWTAAFVHEHDPSHAHLVSNLLGFVIAAVPTWLIYFVRGATRVYWTALVIILVPGVIAVNVTSYLVYSVLLDAPIRYGRGFSSVLGELTGFLLATLLSMFVVLLVTAVQDDGFSLRNWVEGHRLVAGLAVGATPLVVLLVGSLLIVDVSGSGSITNVVGHGAGVIVGLLVGFHYASDVEWIEW